MKIESHLKKLCDDLDAYTCAVMLPDYDSNVLRTVYSYNLHPSWASLTNPFDETTNNGKAFVTGKPVLKNRIHDRTLRNADYVHPVESVIVVPIKNSGVVIGTLVVIRDTLGNDFGDDDVKTTQETATTISGLIVS